MGLESEINKVRDRILRNRISSEKEAMELLLDRMRCGNSDGSGLSCKDCRLEQFAQRHKISSEDISDCRMVSYGLMVYIANHDNEREMKDCEEMLREIVGGNKPKAKRKPLDKDKTTHRCIGSCKDCANHATGAEDYWMFCSHFHNFVKPDGFCSEFKPVQAEEKGEE